MSMRGKCHVVVAELIADFDTCIGRRNLRARSLSITLIIKSFDMQIEAQWLAEKLDHPLYFFCFFVFVLFFVFKRLEKYLFLADEKRMVMLGYWCIYGFCFIDACLGCMMHALRIMYVIVMIFSCRRCFALYVRAINTMCLCPISYFDLTLPFKLSEMGF